MTKNKFSEKGQALILIVLGMVGLLGITALAIDGGNAFADRRQAQNAADTAAIAAAVAIVNDNPNYITVAQGRAASNGYVNGDGDSTVTVVSPPTTGPYSCASNSSCNDYVQVIIVHDVHTWFAPIVGIDTLTNTVNSVARAKMSVTDQYAFGSAFVSLMPGCKPNGYPNDPFTVGGNALTVVNGSGVFINSNCNGALTQGGSSSMQVSAGITVIGGCNYDTGDVVPAPNCNSGTALAYPPNILWPEPDCSTDGTITKTSTHPTIYEATPGRYDNDNGTSAPSIPPNGSFDTLYLKKGVYCLGGDFTINGGNVTSDLNGNNTTDSNEGVLLYITSRTANLTFNGNGLVTIFAMTDLFPGLLIYAPLANPTPNSQGDITITGSSGSTFIGTILAPDRNVKVVGGGGVNDTSYTMNVSCQIVSYTTQLSGGGTVIINYDDEQNYDVTFPPQIEISQ